LVAELSLWEKSQRFADRRIRKRIVRAGRKLRRFRYRLERVAPKIAMFFYSPQMISVFLLGLYVRVTRQKWTELKLLFIHIPKTGGSTITQVLRPRGLVEARSLLALWKLVITHRDGGPRVFTLNHIEPEILVRVGLCSPQQLQNIAFTVFRNPYDRAWSSYRHLCRVPGRRLKRGTGFDEFVELLSGDLTWRTRYSKSFGPSHGAPQSQWVTSPKWPGPRFIFNLERPAEIETFLSSFFGERIILHQANVGRPIPSPSHFPYKDSFDSRFTSDFELGGYEFETNPHLSSRERNSG
jgi:hypothetical protein